MSIAEKLKQYKNKNIHIVGIGGAEGSAIVEFLVANGISSITGHDFSEKSDFKKAFNNTHLSLKPKEREEALNHLLNLPIIINFKDHYLKDIEEADIVFVSQVWFKYPQNMPILENLKDNRIPFKTITNLYFELAPCQIISVTGTNGKTTTSRLIYSIFEKWKKENRQVKIFFAGNDRQNVQVLDKLQEMRKDDVLILETSSTQLLLNSDISPHIGVITNISPNHLDDHGSFENYIDAKKNLIRHQKKDDFAVLNYDDLQTRKIAEEFKDNSFLFSRKEKLKEGCFKDGDKIIIRKKNKEVYVLNIKDIKIPGNHNLENILAAISSAYLFGIGPEVINIGISKYTGTKHRLNLLYNIDGIKYYDDTQATTPEATVAGIESFDDDIILFAGGDDKGMNYKEMAKKINDKVRLLILFPGDASEKIENLINKNKIDFVKVNNLKQAIEELKRYYKKTELTKGSTVLISPGAAHFYSKFVESTNKTLKDWIKLLK
ncbi:MAG: UDP-N-acetylmuramoyl-L-alanine--D-glutamate ligase [Patescibacteria group bacterium]|nr:UDP-N-acetylmuramoyl-L-alanine--D-glutamate ligase [Patescibacteria group bacterium]